MLSFREPILFVFPNITILALDQRGQFSKFWAFFFKGLGKAPGSMARVISKTLKEINGKQKKKYQFFCKVQSWIQVNIFKFFRHFPKVWEDVGKRGYGHFEQYLKEE
jgi:hypothetical protein